MPYGPYPRHSHGAGLPRQPWADGKWAESSKIIPGSRQLLLLGEIQWALGTEELTNLVYLTALPDAIRLTPVLFPRMSTKIASLCLRHRLRLPPNAAVLQEPQRLHLPGRSIVPIFWAMRAAIPSMAPRK